MILPIKLQLRSNRWLPIWLKPASDYLLIIDVRDNGGGTIGWSGENCGLFCSKGNRSGCYQRLSSPMDKTYHYSYRTHFPDMKLVWSWTAPRLPLRNSGRCTGDLDRAVIIGERTWEQRIGTSIRPAGLWWPCQSDYRQYYIQWTLCAGTGLQSPQRRWKCRTHSRQPGIDIQNRKNGRLVRDGGGILPDLVTIDLRKLNISITCSCKICISIYATRYAQKHEKIAPAATFCLSDAEFKDFQTL